MSLFSIRTLSSRNKGYEAWYRLIESHGATRATPSLLTRDGLTARNACGFVIQGRYVSVSAQPNIRLVEKDVLPRERESVHEKESISDKTSLPGTATPDIDLPILDQKWQSLWTSGLAVVKDGASKGKEQKSDKYYILPMFPYPSGNLHMGHLRVYTIADVLSRWKHMSGFQVLNPMGWDAFGLPAENAAIERSIDPEKWTKENISKMKTLLKAMNTNFTWEKELSTCDPKYFKHTQRIFLLLWQHGLAYQAKGFVNWDPVDKTVLANEQVGKDGRSWRSGAKVEQRSLTQWYIKVTAFRNALLEDLDLLAKDNRWPNHVISMQKNWIGHTEGAKLTFMVSSDRESSLEYKPVEVFTTRPDTLFGIQYLALSASHQLVTERLDQDEGLRDFVSKIPFMPAGSKQGYLLKGVEAVNPSVYLDDSLDIHHNIPVFVAPYVLNGYGEGAVMGVPGHDERDFAFWKQNSSDNYIRYVIRPSKGGLQHHSSEVFTEAGELNEHCGSFQGLSSQDAGRRFIDKLSKLKVARKSESWRLRDWLISRQRYWGTPIPIIHCKSCQAVPVPIDQLPVKLPKLNGDWFKGKAGNPLEYAHDWINTPCPSCGQPAKRDTDTMDTFVDSSWYFMRFADAENTDQPFSESRVDEILPVDVYIGGVEHAILHLLYARFMSKFFSSIGLWPGGRKASVNGEPFQRLISQGMVHGKTFTEPNSGKFLRPDELDMSTPGRPKILKSGGTPSISFQKMSKSKYNGVDPSKAIEHFGADVVRAHVLFAAPVTDVLDWDESKIVGAQRWLRKLWRHVHRLSARVNEVAHQKIEEISIDNCEETVLSHKGAVSWEKTQELLRSITSSYENSSLNTLVSDLMKLTHHVLANDGNDFVTDYFSTSLLLRAMAPVTPAFAEESWWLLQKSRSPRELKTSIATGSIFDEPFPVPNSQTQRKIRTHTCAVQHNGKLKFTVELPVLPPEIRDPELWVLEKLKSTEKGSAWLQEKCEVKWKKIILVRRAKTVNFVS